MYIFLSTERKIQTRRFLGGVSTDDFMLFPLLDFLNKEFVLSFCITFITRIKSALLRKKKFEFNKVIFLKVSFFT